MGNLTDKQLLKELRDRLEERKKFEDELNEHNKDYWSVTQKLKDSQALKSHFISLFLHLTRPRCLYGVLLNMMYPLP